MKKAIIYQNRMSIWLVGLLFPVVNFILALFKPNKFDLRVAIICFFTFVGVAFYFELGDISDISANVSNFLHAGGEKHSFWAYFHSIPEAQQVDYYMPFMTWFVSRFTSNYHVFLGCLALLNACFFAANVKYLIDHFNVQGIGVLLLVVFVFVPRIIMLTHRWWMALQVFVYGLLPVLYEKKYWKLLWCIVTPFVFHFSFFYPLIILIIALFLPHKILWPYLLVYFASFVMDTINIDVFNPFLNQIFNSTIVMRTVNYVNYEHLEHNLFSQTATIAINIVNIVLVLFCYIRINKTRFTNKIENETIRRIFTVVLSLAAFSLIASKTEWGWRYNDLSNMLFMFFYLVFISNENRYKESRQIISMVSPLLLYFIAFQIRGFLTIIGPYQLLFGNYFTTWGLEDTNSIWYSIM